LIVKKNRNVISYDLVTMDLPSQTVEKLVSLSKKKKKKVKISPN